MPSLWDFPYIYELVQQAPSTQIDREVATVVDLLGKHGIRSGRMLELACGPAAHSIAFAQHGFRVEGLDRSSKMLERAAERASQQGVDLELHQGNVTNFVLAHDRYDCVVFMAETYPLITKRADLHTHFASVRQVLRDGGLYVIDIDATRHGVGSEKYTWGEREFDRDNGTVRIWHEALPGDWVESTSHLIMYCEFETDEGTIQTRDEQRCRRDSPTHLEWLVRSLNDWHLVGFYSWEDGSPDIRDLDHYFMVLN